MGLLHCSSSPTWGHKLYVQCLLMVALMMMRNWTLISTHCKQGAAGREWGEPDGGSQGRARVLITRALCSDEVDPRRSWEAQKQDQLCSQAPAQLQHSPGKEQGRQSGLKHSSCAGGQSHGSDI